MKQKRELWFAVPPYKKGSWTLVDENGEQVAEFERKQDCIRAMELNNNEIKQSK